jgi:hypothetical protein
MKMNGAKFLLNCKIEQVTKKYKAHRTELTKLTVVNLKETALFNTSGMSVSFVLSVTIIFLTSRSPSLLKV